jgi:hypothetical protein
MAQKAERLTLPEQLRSTLEEARILLPGIQAMFGFQLIAVFSAKFGELDHLEQILHLVATLLTLVSVAMALTPTALHRQLMPHSVSTRLVDSASRFLTLTLVPLVLGFALELKILAHAILDSDSAANFVAVCTFAGLIGLWFVYPRLMKRALHTVVEDSEE